jgi:arylsulfatase A-like enzyme
MTNRPNILILMADQMQARVRLPRAYAPSATCEPSRASPMTGLLPYNNQTSL